MADLDTPERDPIGWPEGQTPSAINDGARALMAGRAQERDNSAARFSELIQARCQPGFASLVDRAAQARGMTQSEYVRQAARTALQLDGFDPAAIAPRDAGALCDTVEGRQRYALVDGGQIVTMSYSDTKPEQDGRLWLPVVHEDSEPFDPLKHWRLAPTYTIVDVYAQPDRVVVTYPVVLKSMEYA